MAVRKKTKLPLKKKKAMAPSKKTNAVKGKNPRGKSPIKPAKKKLKAAAKTVKKKLSAKISPKVKRPAKTKKKMIAVKKLSKKRTLQKSRPSDNIETKGERLHSLKKILKEKRESILKEAKEELARYISGENRQLVDTALDDGDWAVVDTSEDMNLMRLTVQRKTLLEIDEALRRIAEGTYGICEECGDEISEKRLVILPAASLCINCKEEKEKFEAIEKEDLH